MEGSKVNKMAVVYDSTDERSEVRDEINIMVNRLFENRETKSLRLVRAFIRGISKSD